MGFGFYCVNCHASAKSESTFSDLNNVLGAPDTFTKFYFQDQPPQVFSADQVRTLTPPGGGHAPPEPEPGPGDDPPPGLPHD